MARRSLLLATLFLCGCGGGLERASFVTDQLRYQPEGRVGLSLFNTGADSLGVNLCLSRLVDAVDRTTAGPDDGETCALEAQSLDVQGRLEVRKTIPRTTPLGRWRYETTLRLGGDRAEKVFTPEFVVGP
jgi:hypothetical protein